MNKNLYELMNWPDIEGIVYAECDKPKQLLGGHLCDKGFLVQVFRPDAVSVSIKAENRKMPYVMEKVDEAGFFAVLIPSKKKVRYTVVTELVSGEKVENADAYSFADVTDDKKFTAFHAGQELHVCDVLGSRCMTIDGVDGVLFNVWAPAAINVSVVGDFNKYDGRVNPMQRIGDSGVFELFMPGLKAGCGYMYEVKSKRNGTVRKLDPMSAYVTEAPMNASVVAKDEDISYSWGDREWMQARKRDAAKTKPMAAYELSLAAWSAKCGKKDYASMAADIASYVKKSGYTHVHFMPVAQYDNEQASGYLTSAYYAPSSAYGRPCDFKKMVDVLHREGIGVIIDWNAAYFGTEAKGLYDFDGGCAYGYLKPSLEKNPDREVITFDYGKGAVRSFLMSNLLMWLDEYHVDGVKIDGVASMLYLDYGKNPSEWTPNMYGGNENLEAIDFLKKMNETVAKRKDGVITIAEESSGWFGVTTADNKDSLGFSFKWNNCWTSDFLEFMETDPLFRKGEYDRLTYGMLYNYGEDFTLALSHDDFEGESMYSRVSGQNRAKKLADIRAAYGFLYAHPGNKLLSMGQDIGLPMNWQKTAEYWDEANSEEYKAMQKFIEELNAFYTSNKAMYELDGVAEGFEWLDNGNAEETVIAFARMDKEGNKLTIVVNFTPVDRPGYRLHVGQRGRYKEVFNSALKKYGGDRKADSSSLKSDNDGDDWEYIDVNLSGLSFAIYSCEPYSQLEIEEIDILKKAAAAKREAVKVAEEAERLRVEAEAEAKRAEEARIAAEKAFEEAKKAKEEAERRAAQAEEASKKIDVETKKKLEQLKSRKS